MTTLEGLDQDVPTNPARRFAWFMFAVLFAMNLLDYTDRWILSAVIPQVRAELKINNEQAGTLAACFLVSYAVFCPCAGYAGDRMRRTTLLAIGVGVWSLATLFSAMSETYLQLCVSRGMLGIGEAVNGVITPAILMDLFPRKVRARVLSAFYIAIPVGAAIGMSLGGWLGPKYDWHFPLFLVGAPGFIMAIIVGFLPDPVRGASEGVDSEKLKVHEQVGASKEDYVDLMVNSSYTYSVLGMAFYTFAIGGLAFWLPTFLTLSKGMDQATATTYLGLTTLFASIIGMSLGGLIADRWANTNPKALFIVPGIALLGSIPFVVMAIHAKSPALLFGSIFFAEALMFINTGPCNAVIANVVMPNMRATAYAAATFALHFLGDIWSPTLVGWIADTFGRPDSMNTIFGKGFAALGALPSIPAGGGPPENLKAGLLVVVPALLLAGIVLLAGARHLPREMALMLAKLKAPPRPKPSANAVVKPASKAKPA